MKTKVGRLDSNAEDEMTKPELEKNDETNQPVTKWQFHSEDTDDNVLTPAKTKRTKIQPVMWTASEFIAHEKSAKWYVLLTLTTVVFAGAVYAITRDKISAGIIIFAAFVFGFYAGRQPRVLEYRLDESGLSIGEKSYSYGQFKSFALLEEGALTNIILMPLKRFMPLISIYFEPKDEKKITDILAEHLPVEDHKLDAVDNLMEKIRF